MNTLLDADANKVSLTIKSCRTQKQLDVARAMYVNLCKKYKYLVPEYVTQELANDFQNATEIIDV